jgi:Holliday junction resolvase RusA-like endonuclease
MTDTGQPLFTPADESTLYDATVSICFRVPGPPVGKAVKLSTVCGHASARNTPATASYQNLVCHLASLARPHDWPMDALYSVLVLAVFPRPKRLLERSKRTGALLHASEHRMRYESKPDLDNVLKAVADGCTKAGLWTDDCRIDNWDGSRRVYAAVGEEAHTEVIVTRIVGKQA